ncbi:OmpA family protein [Flavobacterium sp.]|uniref:OmpA family protein n=1 Tax=Flavobacterium sp. TaxID=239 RepID=UPI003D6B3D78
MKKAIFSIVFVFTTNAIFSQDSLPANEAIRKTTFSESNSIFKVTPTKINSDLSEIGSAIFMNKYIMYSSRKTGAIGAGKDPETNNPYNTLYCISMNKETGDLSKPYFFASVLDSEGNEGGLSFTPDNMVVYYTKSAVDNSKNYQLYKSVFDEECRCKWIKEEAVEFSSPNYSIENPAVSPDGKKIYFSSNMPGGFGGYDLYVADINSKGIPVNPKNLGSRINTSKDEKFPSVSAKNEELYFSSNGHLGYGGQDVFVSRIKKNNYSIPLNLGKTINTPTDEVAFILATEKQGYVTSNRESSVGSYDIFKVVFEKKPSSIKGVAVEEESKIVLPNTQVDLINEDGEVVSTQMTNDKGEYTFDVQPVENYTIAAVKDGYSDYKLPFISPVGESTSNIELAQKKATIIKNRIAVENIYFDFDKANIKSESTLSLNKILEVLNENSNMKIRINSHTDSRGSDRYNLALSEKRAKETKQYLINKGINKKRIEAKGLGETKPLSNCGSNCTNEQFTADRRSEFIIK